MRSVDLMRKLSLSAAFRAAANDWSGALLFALGFAHERLETREVGQPEVATLAAQQTDGDKLAQLARNRLAMGADAIGNIG
jgi:DNA-binding FadR family transcriptional regulator